MTGLEVLLAFAGISVTALVVAGMILITPRGEVDLHSSETESEGSSLSRAEAPDRAARVPAS